MLTQERLKEVLSYESATGIFRWKIAVNKRHAHAGDIAGRTKPNGYITIRFHGREYYAHRLAFLYMLGRWPFAEVDHINRVPCDNRWSNLRDANRSQNEGNAKQRKSLTGVKGVYFRLDCQRQWQAQLAGHIIGHFATKEEAIVARRIAAEKHFGAFVHHGSTDV